VGDDSVRDEMTSRSDFTRARMNNGQLYVDQGEGLEALEAERTHGKELLYDFNHTRPGQHEERLRLLQELLGAVGRLGLDRATVSGGLRVPHLHRRRLLRELQSRDHRRRRRPHR
jgi:hypothetical protein